MFQSSVFQRKTILLEIIQSKQKPSTIKFLFLLTNKLLDKNISKTNESIPSKQLSRISYLSKQPHSMKLTLLWWGGRSN